MVDQRAAFDVLADEYDDCIGMDKIKQLLNALHGTEKEPVVSEEDTDAAEIALTTATGRIKFDQFEKWHRCINYYAEKERAGLGVRINGRALSGTNLIWHHSPSSSIRNLPAPALLVQHAIPLGRGAPCCIGTSGPLLLLRPITRPPKRVMRPRVVPSSTARKPS